MLRLVDMKLQSKQEFAATPGSIHVNFQAEDGTEATMRVGKQAEELLAVGEVYAVTIRPMADLIPASDEAAPAETPAAPAASSVPPVTPDASAMQAGTGAAADGGTAE